MREHDKIRLHGELMRFHKTSTLFPSSHFRQVNPCLDRIMDPPCLLSDLTLIIGGVNGGSSYVLKCFSEGVGLSTLRILWKLVVTLEVFRHCIALEFFVILRKLRLFEPVKDP